jgi:HKD family nuclease
MRLTISNIGDRVHSELRHATAATVAVAYFLPDRDSEALLRKVSDLTIIYSEEYTINNPYKLEKLASLADVRCIPPDANEGKLHAKVLMVTRPDGSTWAILGSANFTRSGLFENREVCVEFDSNDITDAVEIQSLANWMQCLKRQAGFPNWSAAKMAYDHLGRGRSNHRTQGHSTPHDVWVLKTTSTTTKADYWLNFLAEGVVAIGWEDINVDPGKVPLDDLRANLVLVYPTAPRTSIMRAAMKVNRFFRLQAGDYVLLTKGFSENQRQPVFIYGVARLNGSPFIDNRSSWWRFKCPAQIQQIGTTLSKSAFAQAIGKRSLREAIHQLDSPALNRFAQAVRDETGIIVEA